MLKGSSQQNSKVMTGQTLKAPFCYMSLENWNGWVMALTAGVFSAAEIGAPHTQPESLSWRVSPISGEGETLLFQSYLSNQGVQLWKTPIATEHRICGSYEYHLRASRRAHGWINFQHKRCLLPSATRRKTVCIWGAPRVICESKPALGRSSHGVTHRLELCPVVQHL